MTTLTRLELLTLRYALVALLEGAFIRWDREEESIMAVPLATLELLEDLPELTADDKDDLEEIFSVLIYTRTLLTVLLDEELIPAQILYWVGEVLQGIEKTLSGGEKRDSE